MLGSQGIAKVREKTLNTVTVQVEILYYGLKTNGLMNNII